MRWSTRAAALGGLALLMAAGDAAVATTIRSASPRRATTTASRSTRPCRSPYSPRRRRTVVQACRTPRPLSTNTISTTAISSSSSARPSMARCVGSRPKCTSKQCCFTGVTGRLRSPRQSRTALRPSTSTWCARGTHIQRVYAVKDGRGLVVALGATQIVRTRTVPRSTGSSPRCGGSSKSGRAGQLPRGVPQAGRGSAVVREFLRPQ
jgi:hypothetical protein